MTLRDEFIGWNDFVRQSGDILPEWKKRKQLTLSVPAQPGLYFMTFETTGPKKLQFVVARRTEHFSNPIHGDILVIDSGKSYPLMLTPSTKKGLQYHARLTLPNRLNTADIAYDGNEIAVTYQLRNCRHIETKRELTVLLAPMTYPCIWPLICTGVNGILVGIVWSLPAWQVLPAIYIGKASTLEKIILNEKLFSIRDGLLYYSIEAGELVIPGSYNSETPPRLNGEELTVIDLSLSDFNIYHYDDDNKLVLRKGRR